MKIVGCVQSLHHGALRETRREQCSAVKLAQAFTPDINVESGGVNSGITAAVSNVKSIYCGASGGVQQAEWDCSSSRSGPGGEGSGCGESV